MEQMSKEEQGWSFFCDHTQKKAKAVADLVTDFVPTA